MPVVQLRAEPTREGRPARRDLRRHGGTQPVLSARPQGRGARSGAGHRRRVRGDRDAVRRRRGAAVGDRADGDLVSLWFVHEDFTDEERARLIPHFTNLDGPVFALVNLPEVVKGALFARYSRTTKSIRRPFL